MVFVLLVVTSGFAQGAAITNKDKLITAGKLVLSGSIAGGLAIAFDKMSPEASKASIFALLMTGTLVSARVVCGVDINTSQKAISLPLAGPYFPELNWFNAIAFGFGLAEFGLYKNSGKLAAVLKALVEVAAVAPSTNSDE